MVLNKGILDIELTPDMMQGNKNPMHGCLSPEFKIWDYWEHIILNLCAIYRFPIKNYVHVALDPTCQLFILEYHKSTVINNQLF